MPGTTATVVPEKSPHNAAREGEAGTGRLEAGGDGVSSRTHPKGEVR